MTHSITVALTFTNEDEPLWHVDVREGDEWQGSGTASNLGQAWDIATQLIFDPQEDAA